MMDAEQQNQIQIKRDALNMDVMSLRPEHFRTWLMLVQSSQNWKNSHH